MACTILFLIEERAGKLNKTATIITNKNRQTVNKIGFFLNKKNIKIITVINDKITAFLDPVEKEAIMHKKEKGKMYIFLYVKYKRIVINIEKYKLIPTSFSLPKKVPNLDHRNVIISLKYTAKKKSENEKEETARTTIINFTLSTDQKAKNKI